MAAITSQTFHHAPALSIPRGARVAAQAFLALLAGIARHAAAPARRSRRPVRRRGPPRRPGRLIDGRLRAPEERPFWGIMRGAPHARPA